MSLCVPSYCCSVMHQWCCACLWQTLVPTSINACPHLNKPEFQPLSQILFVCSALGSWSPLWKQITYKVAQCMNIHHDNCCHPMDKKSPVPVNHGRPSKSNVGDNNSSANSKISPKVRRSERIKNKYAKRLKSLSPLVKVRGRLYKTVHTGWRLIP